MKLFLTGASGFVGRHLLRKLEQADYEVVAVSRQSPASLPGGVHWLDAGVLDAPERLTEAMRGCDVVVHLAAYAHQTRVTSAEDEAVFERVNVKMTESLFCAAEKAGIGHFLFVSSIAALTSLSERLVTEATSPEPTEHYGVSKLQAEEKLRARARASHIKLTIIRPCLIYGPGNPGNLARLMKLIESGWPLPFGGIRNRRSFVSVDSVAELIMLCLANPKTFGETFIAADDQVLSTPDICRAMASALGRPVTIWYCPVWLLRLLGKVGDLAGFVLRRSPGIDSYSVERLVGSLECSNARAKAVLGWRPSGSFRDAVRKDGQSLA